MTGTHHTDELSNAMPNLASRRAAHGLILLTGNPRAGTTDLGGGQQWPGLRVRAAAGAGTCRKEPSGG